MQPAASQQSPSVTPIPAASIAGVWESLLPGLEIVRQKAAPDLSPDLVRARLERREAFLFLIPVGFFILLPIHDQTPRVLIWAAYAEGGNAIPKYLPAIEALARDIGAHHLEFESDRPGYRRVFRDWQRKGQRYIRRLT